MLSSRDQQVVLERERGDTIVEVGRRHGISHQRVSRVMASATEFVNRVDLDLMVARRTSEVCVLVIPYGEDYTRALDFGQWLIGRLRDVANIEDDDDVTMGEALATPTSPAERRRQADFDAILGVLPSCQTLGNGNLATSPMTTAAVAVKLGKDKTDGTVRRRLDNLKEAGLVERRDGGWLKCDDLEEDHDE